MPTPTGERRPAVGPNVAVTLLREAHKATARFRNARPAAIVLAALAMFLAACSPTGQSHPPATLAGGLRPAPLTATQIAGILAATMSSNNKANASLDLSLLRSYEAGSALAIDSASYEENENVTTSNCAYEPFDVRMEQPVADSGRAYPQRFLVVGQTEPLKSKGNCGPGQCPTADTLLAFERTGPTQPWKIVLEPSAASGKFVALAAEGDTATTLSPANLTAGEAIPGRLAADLTTYGATGQRGELEPSYFGGACWALPDVRSEVTSEAKSGIRETAAFESADDAVEYPIRGGGTLSLFTLDFSNQLAPESSGGSISWTDNANVSPLTALLPTGDYRRITQHGALEVVAETTAGGYFVLGSYAGVTSMTGVRASPSHGGGGGGAILVSYEETVGMNPGRVASYESISPRY
jgi:hypothetical protein